MEDAQRRRLGVVVGGTGVRGFAQAGVLEGLDRAGLHPYALVGVSTGAVVAASYAARPDWLPALSAIDRKRLPTLAARPDEDDSLIRLRAVLRNARQLAPSVWTWGRQGYEEYGRLAVTELLGSCRRFERTRVRLAQVATDLRAGERAILTDGDLPTATLAASALPGVTRPIQLGEALLADGAFADPAPVDVARGMGAERVLVVHPLGELTSERPDNWIQALVRGMEIGQHAFAKERLGEADLVIRPDLGPSVRALDFSGLDDAARRAGAAVLEQAAEIRRLLA